MMDVKHFHYKNPFSYISLHIFTPEFIFSHFIYLFIFYFSLQLPDQAVKQFAAHECT